MKQTKQLKRILAIVLAVVMVVALMPVNAFAAEADDTLSASLEEAKSYIDGITINNSSNDPSTVVQNFKTHFTWDNEKRENSKSYLFDWSYYNGVVFEGIEYVYEVTGESVYKDYVVEYMSSLITSSGGWATCTNNSSKTCAGYNSTHGADCYKTASLLLDAYEMTGDSRYLTMAKTLYADLDSAAKSYSLSNAGMNYRHTWATDPSPDLWLDGLYMILPFRAEYAKYIGDTEELDLIVSRMQWVSDNMYNSSKGLFYHAADSASSNSGTFWLRSIGWYAAAIVDIMDSMSGSNLEAMKAQLVKLVDGMKACQNASNGMWLNNMAASKSSSNPYETSGTALVGYAVMKAVNNGWLDDSYADMAILAFNGICSEKLSGSTLTDICFKGAPGSSNSTFYDNEGKGVGPFIMFYAEVLEYANNTSCDHDYESVTEEATCTVDGAITYTCTLCADSYSEVIPATGEHAYETVTVDATCTEKGSVTTTCTVCAESSAEEIDALGHGYTCVVTDATCSEDGSKVYTCASCADSYSEVIPSTGDHAYETVTVDATCTETGSVTTTCTVCGYSSSEVIAAAGHVYVTSVTAPTCTEEGFTAYSCTVCGSSYTDGRTEALGHAYTSRVTATCTEDGFVVYTCTTCGDTCDGEAVEAFGHDYTTTVVEPTCGKDGYTTYVCATCGHSYTGDIVTAPGHAYEALVTEPACTDGGYTTYTCTSCGDSYISDYTAAMGHAYESVVTEPTFEEMGYTTHTCGICGDVVVDSYVPVKTHSYETVTEAATCTEDGCTTYTCTECGYSYTEIIAALGHTYVVATTDPTCEKDGAIVSTCTICGEKETDVIPALGHDYEIAVIDPTCETDGYTTYTCACGHIETETVPALGHEYETVVTDSTCTKAGAVTDTCAACGHAVTEVIPALGHSYVSASVAPNCSEAGYTTYTCTSCGDSYVADETAALGHSYEAVVTEPTCTGNGYTTYTCAVCGDVRSADPVEALGHNYTTVEADGCLVYTCGVCGDTYSEKVEMTYTKVSSISSGNNYVITMYSNKKYYALSHEGNRLSAVQISVSNGEITSEITEDLVWTYSGSKLSYVDNGTTYYLYAGSSNNGWWGNMPGGSTLSISSSGSSTVSFSNSRLKIGSKYLRYSGGSVSLSSSSGTTYFFVEE